MKNHEILYTCAYTIAVLLFSSFTASAQQTSVAITPLSIDAVVKAGSTYTQTYTIANSTPERLRFRLSSNDMWFDENNRRITTRAGSQPRSASPWVHFSPGEIILEPRSSASVKAVISIPQGATGSYYSVPVFDAMPVGQTMRPVSDTGSAATIGLRFRGLIMLTTAIGSEYNLEILNAAIKPPSPSTVLQLELDVRNRGTAHVKPRGSYAIIDARSQLIGRGEITPHRLLPGQRNVIESKWTGELKPGTYTCLLTLRHDRVGQEPALLTREVNFTVSSQ